jgi:hypothetical protein
MLAIPDTKMHRLVEKNLQALISDVQAELGVLTGDAAAQFFPTPKSGMSS